ncbi:hypothetical protein PR048_012675 [Dryococelus australis]|uniref:Uncharacterized protein n=1 Tax=Dryococelus australis TaxID=614101 RepID=A0ABQ9HQS7_9NEOP|nr:hypothetical protein PR048_012675 [Dryococelus australis]
MLLKKAYHEAYRRWMVIHSHKKPRPDELSHFFNIAFMKVATIEKAVNGFRKTRIFPMDSDTFAEEEFLPCSLQDVDITEQGMENVTPATSPVMPTFQDVAPVLKSNFPTTILSKTRRGRKMHSQVLTSTPQKKCLEDAKQKKADAQKKKEERGRQKNTHHGSLGLDSRPKKKLCSKKNFSESSSEDDTAADLCGNEGQGNEH